jgi:6-phosphofructokinase 2
LTSLKERRREAGSVPDVVANIITLTMNPAIDVSTSAKRVEPTGKLRCSPERRDAGGGGINVARVAARLGATSTAVYPAGGLTGEWLNALVDKEGVAGIAVPITGETREDFTVRDATTGEDYRFVLPGPRLEETEWRRCLAVLADLAPNADFLCASGSLPPGAPTDFYGQVARVAADRGVRFALDASGPALKAALGETVRLIKPNLGEMRELTGAALEDEPSRVAACRDLIGRGRVELVALSLGADGAILVSSERALRGRALSIDCASTVGAGDSFMGAMIWALASKMGLEDAFRLAIAAGSAALLAPGTELARSQDVLRLLSRVEIEDLPAEGRRAARAGRGRS